MNPNFNQIIAVERRSEIKILLISTAARLILSTRARARILSYILRPASILLILVNIWTLSCWFCILCWRA